MTATAVVISFELISIDDEVNMVAVSIVIEWELAISPSAGDVTTLVIVIDIVPVRIECAAEADVFALRVVVDRWTGLASD